MESLNALTLNKSVIVSLDLVLKRFFMIQFKTNNLQIITACQENFGFRPPSELIASRTKKLESSYCT